ERAGPVSGAFNSERKIQHIPVMPGDRLQFRLPGRVERLAVLPGVRDWRGQAQQPPRGPPDPGFPARTAPPERPPLFCKPLPAPPQVLAAPRAATLAARVILPGRPLPATLSTSGRERSFRPRGR